MSEVKVNKISPRTACGTVTLGDSGDTFTIPAGATINNQGTAVNFGATGSASWVTTVKTTGFTAVAGEGYFCNTTSGGFSVNLPAGTAGAVVAIKDYAGTFDTGTLTLVSNGSDKIGGSTVNATLTTEGIAVTLVFIDSTQGWLVTDSGLQTEAPTAEFITATGGTITTACTNFKVHTFTGPGTFTVCSVGNPAGSDSVDYLVVAGGGGGGSQGGGGGGAGGMRFASTTYTTPVCSAPRTGTAFPVSATGFPITVGAGGAGAAASGPVGPGGTGSNGVNATFSTIISTGGGGGGRSGNTSGPGNTNGNTGGSGGGTGKNRQETAAAGNTPPVSPSQGFPGGPVTAPTSTGAGGGGGAGVAGTSGHGPGTPPACGGSQPQKAGPGGDGLQININGSNTYYAGGGGGGTDVAACGATSPLAGTGGQGGGGGGARSPGAPGSNNGQSGTVNTGGGGGGSEWEGSTTTGGSGGSGIVVIRYKFQN